jgi:hypothetical protein
MHPLFEHIQHPTRRQFFGSTGLRLGGAALALLAGRRQKTAELGIVIKESKPR